MFDKLKKKVDDSVVGEKAEALVDKAGDVVATAAAKVPGHDAGHGVGR